MGGLLLLFVIIGIASGGNSGPTGTISGPTNATDDQQPSAQQAPSDASQHIAFGQTFTYQDGTAVGIGEPVAYTPSSSALLPAGTARAVAMKVSITNGTAKPLDLVTVRIQGTAGDQAVEEVIDSAKGILGIQTQTLPPGTRQTFTVVFGVPAGHADFRVQVEPGWYGYQPVFFTGKV